MDGLSVVWIDGIIVVSVSSPILNDGLREYNDDDDDDDEDSDDLRDGCRDADGIIVESNDGIIVGIIDGNVVDNNEKLSWFIDGVIEDGDSVGSTIDGDGVCDWTKDGEIVLAEWWWIGCIVFLFPILVGLIVDCIIIVGSFNVNILGTIEGIG